MNYKRLIESVKHHEGYRERAYTDTLGYETIGYGFAIKNLKLEKDIAGLILERKLQVLIAEVYSRHPWVIETPAAVQEVIVEMCYQLGVGGFSKFKKTIRKLQDKNFKGASVEMLDSRWAKQTPNRAKEMSEIIKGQL
tara:strand:+ start:865 stop:1278 length:414 start_codon:yes stop_codon:yes gene_type:complete